MANRGQSQYLRIFSGGTTYKRWQNYYVNQTVTWESQSWGFFPFETSGFIGGSGSNDDDLSITLPATSEVIALFEGALNNNYLCEVDFYEFSTLLSQAQPPASQLLIGTMVGEVASLGGSFTLLTVGLGSSLAPVGAQVPPRKFTNNLIGLPIRI